MATLNASDASAVKTALFSQLFGHRNDGELSTIAATGTGPACRQPVLLASDRRETGQQPLRGGIDKTNLLHQASRRGPDPPDYRTARCDLNRDDRFSDRNVPLLISAGVAAGILAPTMSSQSLSTMPPALWGVASFGSNTARQLDGANDVAAAGLCGRRPGVAWRLRIGFKRQLDPVGDFSAGQSRRRAPPIVRQRSRAG